MKKFLFLVVLMLTACDPEEYMNYYYGWFYFKNSTDNELIVRLSINESPDRVSEYDDVTLVPGKSEIIFWYNHLLVDNVPLFKDFLVVDTITVCDNNGKELIKYIQGEIKEGQRDVFDEKEWSYTENPDELTYIWQFNITEEDIRNRF